MSWICPKCERELPWPDYRHYCARVSLDTLFEGRPEELVLVFDKILAEVADWPKVLDQYHAELRGVLPADRVFNYQTNEKVAGY